MAYGKAGGGDSRLWLGIGIGAFAAVLLGLLIYRIAVQDDGDGDAAAEDGVAEVTADPVAIPDDGGYADPPADGAWDTDALDEGTYVQVTAETTCMAQGFHGPPDDLGRELDRIYYHYRTTAADVASFAADINADDSRAIAVGERIASAIERCP